MIEAFAAKSGSRSLRVDGIALHSPYDPVHEARRFVREGLGTDPPATVLVLGEGLGYVGDAVVDLFPGARVIQVHYSAEVSRLSRPPTGPAWAPGEKPDLATFLLSHIGELDVEGLRVIEWPPSARSSPSVSRQANDAVRGVIQQLNGSLVTTIGAGRRWIRNSIANFLAFESVLVGAPCAEDRPVLVAAPGPSLEESVKLIRAVLPLVDLWALPSSLPLLREEGIEPDLVVMTDPGHFSIHHLAYALPGCPLAMPISAARGFWNLPARTDGQPPAVPFLLSQPGFLEEALLDAAGVRAPRVPPHGTVAATALDLALASTRAPVIVAGLDMCLRDTCSHARPNAFDTLFHLRASRTAPHDGLVYWWSVEQHATRLEGATGVRTSLSLRTYAGWFNQVDAEEGRTVYRLLPSPVVLAGMRALDGAGLRDLVAGAPRGHRGPRARRHPRYPDRDRRVKIVAGLISDWTRRLESATRPESDVAGLDVVARDASLFSLVHDIEPVRLLEARRRMRHGDRAGAREAAAGMLDGCRAFLRSLAEKTLASG